MWLAEPRCVSDTLFRQLLQHEGTKDTKELEVETGIIHSELDEFRLEAVLH